MTVKTKVAAKAAAKRHETQKMPPPINPKGIRPVYANNIGLSATLTDFTLLFIETGQWPGSEGGGNLHNEIVAAVTLPPPAAAGLMQALQQYIQSWSERGNALVQAMKVDESASE
jgi:hypothetical protein